LGEQLVVPSVFLIGFSFCPMWLQRLWQNRPQLIQQQHARTMGVANGQFMFFTRVAYDHIGGHAAVRSNVVEDVALGRAVSERMHEGLRLFNCDSLEFTTVRMYRSFGETWAGFTKNMRAVFEQKSLFFWLAGLLEFLLFLFPFVAVFICPPEIRHMVFLQLGVIYAIRFLLAYRLRTSMLGAALHPLGIALLLLIGLNSWRCSIGRGVRWKGRIYHPEI
jgi:chlorobactene glucosyltransferase